MFCETPLSPPPPPAAPPRLTKVLFLDSTVTGSRQAGLVSFVSRLYGDLLGRAPDPGGLAGWVGALQGGATRAQVAQAVWESPECRGRQVDGYYEQFLHRAADPGGRAAFVNAFLRGAGEIDVQLAFVTSGEYLAAHPGAGSFLTGLYGDVLGRPPDAGGMAALLPLLQDPRNRAGVARMILASDEAARRFVNACYVVYLHRPADPGGLNAWAANLDGGALTPGQFAGLLLASDEYYYQG